MCRLQHTKSGASKLILIRPIIAYNRKYNALPHNYKNSHNIEDPAFVFQNEINRLTQSSMCFTLEELER